MTAPDLLHFDVASPEPAIDEILIRCRFGRCRVGVSCGNHACMVIPVEDSPRRHARLAGRLRVRVEPRVLLRSGGDSFQCAAVVIECTDRSLLATFRALSAGIVEDVDRNDLRESGAVLQAVREWERLFNGRRGLGRREEIGLWGELQFMLESDDIESEVVAWQASAPARLDFVDVRRAREIKTSTGGHRHRVGVNQIALGDHHPDAVLVSYWIADDPAGVTLPMQIERVRASLTYTADFERGLLRWGYRDADRERYERRFDVVGTRLDVAWPDLPRVRSWDRGADDIGYEIDLDH